MNSPPDRGEDARLAALLLQPLPPLPDSGFSEGVLRVLPATRSVLWSRRSACGVGAAVGTLVALIGPASRNNLSESWTPVVTAFAPVAARLSEPAVVSELLAMVGDQHEEGSLPSHRAKDPADMIVDVADLAVVSRHPSRIALESGSKSGACPSYGEWGAM